MKTRRTHTMRLGIALAAICAALSAGASGQTPFVTVRDDMSRVLSRTQFLSHADPGLMLHVNISLKSPNAAALKSFVDDVSNPRSPNYRHFLSPTDAGARFGQSASVVQTVSSYLQSQGFRITLIGKSRLNVMADGTIAQAEKAFHTTINQYKTLDPKDVGRPVFFATAAPVQAPSTIAANIMTVSGLQNYSQPKPALLTINQAHTLYGIAKEFAAGMYGQGRTLAYSNYDGYRLSNLPLYYSAYSLPAPSGGVGSNVTIVPIDGGAGTGTPNGEGDLDMQMILGMAPQCNLIIYDGSQNPMDVLTKEQDDNSADVISESYGWGMPPADEDACHQVHLLMSAQGITYLCASGDGGTSYLDQDEAPYPDIDPDILVVGGTIATTDSAGNRLSEVAWPNSGGGYTTDAAICNALPSYQKLGTPGIPSGIPYRLLPDVAVNAGGSGEQGAAFPFYWNGQLIDYGSGTSFSSPMFCGGLGMAEQKLAALGLLAPDSQGKQRFGRINDLFYSQKLRPDVWYDITSGSNGSLPNGNPSNAGIGWDTVTGLGAISFDGFVNSFGVTVGLGISPTTVLAGTKATGTVTLSAAAGSGGDTVTLTSSDPSYVSVPASITIPAGSKAATFSIATTSASANYTSKITASFSGQSGSASLTVMVDSIASLGLSPSTILGGQSSTGTVRLTSPAPVGGWAVKLKTSDPSEVGVPTSVTVPAGATSASFSVSAATAAEAYTATVTAYDTLSTESATLTVNNLAISGLTLNPTTVIGGNPSIGTVTLGTPAPAGGLTLRLTSNSSSASVPASVTVAAGATSAKFTVSTLSVQASASAIVSCLEGATGKSATLTIVPITLQSVSVAPSTFVGGSQTVVTGTVSFNGPSLAPGQTVTLTSSNPKIVSVPASVSVAAGAKSATFAVTHSVVQTPQAITITAKWGTVVQTATLSVNPFEINGFTISPTTVTGGNNATGTVTLNATPSSTSGPISVRLMSPSQDVVLPAACSIPVGSPTGKFTIATTPVLATVTVPITAIYGFSSMQANLTIETPILLSVSVSPTTVKGSSTTKVIGTVTLTGPAVSLTLISLTSSDPAAAGMPAKVVIAPGKTSVNFPVTHSRVATTVKVTITASLSGTTKTTVLTVTP